MEDDTHSVTINIPKRRECPKSVKSFLKEVRINKILKRSMERRSRRIRSEVSFQKFFLHSVKPLTLKHFKRDELLVPFKVYTKTQDQGKHKHKLTIKYNEKYKVIRTDMQRRLHVEYPPNDIHALTDVDEECFHYVNGRSLKDRAPLFKSLKLALAQLFRLRQQIGYKNDAILNIETNCRKELRMYEVSLNRFMLQAKCFDSFISEDYLKSMDFLEKYDTLKSELQIKIAELHNVATEQFTIISRLMGLDYLYSKQQKYGRFLYYLSPPSWRSKHREFARSVEIEAKGFDLGYSSEEDPFNEIFEKMQKECIEGLVKPVLYFTHPHDLLVIFDGIEKQQLYHFSHVAHLAPRKKAVNESILSLKEKINLESASVSNMIKDFETLLEYSYKRRDHLECRFFTILNGLFYESVGAPEVLKLFVHLEFCYERIFAEKPISLDIITMAKSLENFYMDYTKRLDSIHCHTIQRSVAKCIENERRKMRRARYAARELCLFERLERDLLRAYEPVVDGNKPQLAMPPSKGGNRRKSVKREYFKVNMEEQKPLDESEIEYLSLFTDWTEGDDPSKYLHRLEEEQ